MAEDKNLKKSILSIPELVRFLKEKFDAPSTPPVTPPTTPVISADLMKVKTVDGVELSISGKMEVGAVVTDATGKPTPSQKYTLEDGSVVETDAESKIVSVTPSAPKAAEEMSQDGVPTPSQVTKQLGDLEKGISSITIKYSEMEASHKKTISDFEKLLKEANDRQKKTDDIVKDMFKLVEKIAEGPSEKSKFSKKDGVKIENTSDDSIESWRAKYLKN